jgi:hypothetical protein
LKSWVEQQIIWLHVAQKPGVDRPVKTRPVRKRKDNDSVNTADSKLQITKKKYCGTVLEGFWDLEKDREKKV